MSPVESPVVQFAVWRDDARAISLPLSRIRAPESLEMQLIAALGNASIVSVAILRLRPNRVPGLSKARRGAFELALVIRRADSIVLVERKRAGLGF